MRLRIVDQLVAAVAQPEEVRHARVAGLGRVGQPLLRAAGDVGRPGVDLRVLPRLVHDQGDGGVGDVVGEGVGAALREARGVEDRGRCWVRGVEPARRDVPGCVEQAR